MQAEDKKVLCILEELAGEHEDQVCAVANLIFLLLSRKDEDFSGWVDHFEFSQNGRGVRGDKCLFQVVDYNL